MSIDWTEFLDQRDVDRLRARHRDQAELDVGVQTDNEWWKYDGSIVAAMAEGGGNTVHCARVNWLGRCYSMSPFCLSYRKADGTELAKHARGQYPMLTRNLGVPFDEYRTGVRRTHRPLCRHCVAVRDREQGGDA